MNAMPRATGHDIPEGVEPMLRLPAVRRLTGAGKTTIYRWIRQGRFPKPITINPGFVAWLECDVFRWQRQRFDSTAAP